MLKQKSKRLLCLLLSLTMVLSLSVVSVYADNTGVTEPEAVAEAIDAVAEEISETVVDVSDDALTVVSEDEGTVSAVDANAGIMLLLDDEDANETTTDVAKIGDSAYSTVSDAIAAVESSGTITLTGDVSETSITVPAEKTITLDLDGHTLTLTGGTTYTDTGYSNRTFSVSLLNQGSLTVTGGVIQGSGTYTNDNTTYYYVDNTIINTGTLTVESGTTVNGKNYAVTNLGGSVTTYGNITAELCDAIVTYGGFVTVNGGTITATSTSGYGCAIDIFGRNYSSDRDTETTKYGATVTINDGTINAYCYDFSTNNLYSGDSCLNIYGGIIESVFCCIYWPTPGTITVGKEDSTSDATPYLKNTGGSGIVICCGKLKVYSGTIEASYDATESTPFDSTTWAASYRTNSGMVGLADAISVIANRSSAYAEYPLEINLEGGTYISASNYAVRYLNCNAASDSDTDTSQNISVELSGGTYTGGETLDGTAVAAIDTCEYEDTSNIETLTVTGGSYSSDVSEYVSDDVTMVTSSDGTYSVYDSGSVWDVSANTETDSVLAYATVNSDGKTVTLHITGIGNMKDYEVASDRPWHSGFTAVDGGTTTFSKEAVTEVEVESGVTKIGAYAFASLMISHAIIPSSVTTIAEYAFTAARPATGDDGKYLPVIVYMEGNTSYTVNATSEANVILAYLNGGSLDSVAEWSTDGTLATPTKENDTFGGWYRNSSFSGTSYETGEKGKTYYAKWNSASSWDVSANEDGSVLASVSLNSDGTVTLHITGTGAMKDFTSNTERPWHYGFTVSGANGTFAKESITNIEIEEGVTHIGALAFCSTKVSNVVVPASVESIGEDAFAWVKGYTADNTNYLTIVYLEGDTDWTLSSGETSYVAQAYLGKTSISNENTNMVPTLATTALDEEGTGTIVGWYGNKSASGTSVTTAEAGKTYYSCVAVAQIADIPTYTTLADAISAASSSDTIMLLASVNEDVVIESGKTITLDLAGYSITAVSSHAIEVEYGAELTVEDSSTVAATETTAAVDGTGKVQATVGSKAALYNQGKVTLNGGYFTRTSGTGYTIVNDGWDWDDNGESKLGTVAEMIFNDGVTVETSSDVDNTSSMIRNYGGTMTINGGTFISDTVSCIKNEPDSTLTIEDGLIKNLAEGASTKQGTIINAGTVTVNGGEIYSYSSAIFGTSSSYYGKVLITGGTFTNLRTSVASPLIGSYQYNTTTDDTMYYITGGTFKGYSIYPKYLASDEYSLLYDYGASDSYSSWEIVVSNDTSGWTTYEAKRETTYGTVYLTDADAAFNTTYFGSNTGTVYLYAALDSVTDVAVNTTGYTLVLMDNTLSTSAEDYTSYFKCASSTGYDLLSTTGTVDVDGTTYNTVIIYQSVTESSANASITIDGTPTYYATLGAAIIAANSISTDTDVEIKLTGSHSYTGIPTPTRDMTIDLNGKAYTGTNSSGVIKLATDGITVTVKDSVGGGSMGRSNASTKLCTLTAGTLELTSGTYTGTFTSVTTGTLKITGGTYTSDPKSYVATGYTVEDNDDDTYKYKVVEDTSVKLGGSSVETTSVISTSVEYVTDSSGNNSTIYVGVSASDISNFSTTNYPTTETFGDDNTGYIFAGWYTGTSEDDALYAFPGSDEGTSSVDTYYAKFVDANVLSVQCVITNGQRDDDANTNYWRFLTSVDSFDYSAVGFNVTDEDGTAVATLDGLVYNYVTISAAVMTINKTDFSSASQYVVTNLYSDSNKTYSSLKAQAYWTTYDGTTVYGASETFTTTNDFYPKSTATATSIDLTSVEL